MRYGSKSFGLISSALASRYTITNEGFASPRSILPIACKEHPVYSANFNCVSPRAYRFILTSVPNFFKRALLILLLW